MNIELVLQKGPMIYKHHTCRTQQKLDEQLLHFLSLSNKALIQFLSKRFILNIFIYF